MIENRFRIQNYLDKLENHLEVNKKDFIKEKCKVIVLVGVINCRNIRSEGSGLTGYIAVLQKPNSKTDCKLQTVSDLSKFKRIQNKKQNI